MSVRVPPGVRLQDAWRNSWLGLGNLARRAARRPLDYVVLDLAGSLPEHVPPRPWWQRSLPALPGGQSEGLSLAALRAILERIAADPRPKGVILRLDQFAPAGWGTAGSVREALGRFRQSGKRLVAYSDEYSTLGYFVAAAADEILLAPGGGWNVLGLRIEATFLKDALDAIGVQAEVFNVSPYKSAGDMFSQADMSPEYREMLNWVLDGQYAELVDAIAAGRGLEAARVRELIDTAPKMAREAAECNLVDRVCYFDEVAERLYEPSTGGTSGTERGEGVRGNWARRRMWERLGRRRKKEPGEAEAKTAKLITWGEANRLLPRPIRWRSGKAIGVVALEGTIIPGESQRLPLPIPLPFLGRSLAGSDTVSRALRRAEKDDRVAAVVFYVDSRGGSATASDLIWREVARLRRKKPVVACLANAAASGGYYVAAGADWIISQPLTLTGSIGVIVMRFALAGLVERLRARQVSLERGARAGLFSSPEPLDESGRKAMQGIVDEYYRQFHAVVTGGRRLQEDRLESIAGGRVWLGRQALGLSLVDQLGDLYDAVEKAKELGKVDQERWTPAVWFSAGRGASLPPPFPSQSPAAWFERLWGLASDRAWMIAPVDVEISG